MQMQKQELIIRNGQIQIEVDRKQSEDEEGFGIEALKVTKINRQPATL